MLRSSSKRRPKLNIVLSFSRNSPNCSEMIFSEKPADWEEDFALKAWRKASTALRRANDFLRAISSNWSFPKCTISPTPNANTIKWENEEWHQGKKLSDSQWGRGRVHIERLSCWGGWWAPPFPRPPPWLPFQLLPPLGREKSDCENGYQSIINRRQMN